MQRIKDSEDEETSEVEALLEGLRPALDDETLICECYCVSLLDIREACAKTRLVDVEMLQRRFGLGTGCGQCVKDLAVWHDRVF